MTLKERQDYGKNKLTDKEKRIFLAAMHREYEVCKEIDKELIREPHDEYLTSICNSIRCKVKKALF